MDFVNELLDKISTFRCNFDGVEEEFTGILQEENRNIILNAKFSPEQYREIKKTTDIDVFGEVSGTNVTLMRCHISFSSWNCRDNYFSTCAVPSEIIVGGHFPLTPMIKRIIVSTSALNNMFGEKSPLEFNINFSKGNPVVLNYTFPEPIIADDKYGKIQIYQTIEPQLTVEFYKYDIISCVDYSFTDSLPLMDAVARVSVARSLFSFFGNGYIPFGVISFQVDDDENAYRLWLNYTEDIPAVKDPFLIRTTAFENQFQNVWNAWLDLYEGANPIHRLFYELICCHSTGINGFLNLSQAIEVYSNAFRYEEARKLAESDSQWKRTKEIPLKYIYQDILSEYNGVLELTESDIADYARGFSNMRNYYTHYNSKKYVEPTYDELFSASHILRLVLLTIVYIAVGIPDDCILECKRRHVFRGFDEDAMAILNYSKKVKAKV